MNFRNRIDRQLEAIKDNYIIPTNIEPILRNAISIRQEIEDSYEESEKEGIVYLRLKTSIDLHIAGIVSLCFARNSNDSSSITNTNGY